MAYLELFERVADQVRRQGVKVTFKRGKPLTVSAIERARAKALIPIPTSMAEFYSEIGDGIVFAWTVKGDRTPFANHEFPKLAERTLESFDKLSWMIEWKDDYDFRGTKDPTLAKQTALKMRKWMPFHDEGNGDGFCLDTAIDSAPVVFDQHDWFDGGTGENGHLLGRSLLEFYTNWSRVCFQFPQSLWWPSVLRKSGPGVDWNSTEFREPFRLPEGDS
ncbi:MAG: SMI1/KNR4 family protein [Chthoniobacterales bacterium]|nr:SMI1/KNR4 family protein [Chthoniobacterales bacterium]